MSDRQIQWPRAKYWDKPWNPIVGCQPCSPACEYCYARAIVKDRFGQSFEPHYTKDRNPPRKGVVFCGNATDLFGDWCAPIERADFIIRAAQRGMGADADYLWLTKRVDNMCDALRLANKAIVPGEALANHYFGFTAENQEWYNKRFCESCQLPDLANWWISCEPLLGPIDLGLTDRHPITGSLGTLPRPPSWVVVGCESGPNRRPCNIEWVESIAQQCADADVPVFVKQLDIGGKCVTDITKFPKHLQIRQVPWAKEGGI